MTEDDPRGERTPPSIAITRASSMIAVSFLAASTLTCRQPQQVAVTARDSAGVTILQVLEEGMAGRDGPALTLVPFTTEPPDFGDILDVAIAPGAHLVVLDPSDVALVVLDSMGGERARFGRAGAGPGEFRPGGLTKVVVLGDTVVVPDILSQRVTLFDLDGDILEILPIDVGAGLMLDWRSHPDGGLIFRRATDPPRLEVLSVDGSQTRPVFDFAPLSMPSPVGAATPLPIWCVLPDGRLAWGRTDRYDLAVSAGNEVAARLRGDLRPRPVGDDEIEHLSELLNESLRRRTGSDAPPERLRQLLEQVGVPEEGPLVADLECGEPNRVWVQHALPITGMGQEILRVGTTHAWGSHTWDVFDLGTTGVARVVVPDNARITRVSASLIVGYSMDASGRKTPIRWRNGLEI